MKLVFMGTPAFAVESLLALVKHGFTILAVVTQPDRPKGRGNIMSPSPVKGLAIAHNLPVFQPEKILHIRDELAAIAPDCIVVVAYGQILPEDILNLPRLGCINLHASLLPAYRGASPVQWAIIRGEIVTGLTTIQMDKGMDTGDILLQKEVPVKSEDTARTLHDKLAVEGAHLLIDTLNALQNGTLAPTPQDHSKATLAPPLKKTDGLIHWARPAIEIVNLVRGCDPWPSAFTYHEGAMLKIWAAAVSVEGTAGTLPGTVVKIDDHGIHVAAGEGAVLVLEIQREGKKRQKADAFLRGYSISISDKFSHRLVVSEAEP